MKKRVFLIVLDSFGIGEAPDADKFGDTGSSTIRSVAGSGSLHVPNTIAMGLGNIEGVDCLAEVENPTASYGRMIEKSKGKDTTTGHWEIGGVISSTPFPTYPKGFPSYVIEKFEKATGRGVICNKPYSGTQVIADYGEEHLKSGKLIVYTSADSVFQIAAHKDIVSIDDLYSYCKIARKILSGKDAVGRVIARPFAGAAPNFYRTDERRDFSLEPSGTTILDAMKYKGYDVIAVGKISDIFAGRGVTKSVTTHGNAEGMLETSRLCNTEFNGLCFVNLVDFDMKYGHRNDAVGYATALSEFDNWLGKFVKSLRHDDVLMITADHGCDPGDISTDHTREYVPLLVYSSDLPPKCLGTRSTFADISATIADWFELSFKTSGKSMAGNLEVAK